MSEHYTPETFAARRAKILAHPLYGAPWPLPPQNAADQLRANGQMVDWCRVNLALCSCGAKIGIARIYDYDGITSITAWDHLTAAYRQYYPWGDEGLRPIYAWLQSTDRITVAGAKHWLDVEAPLVLVDRRVFINSPRAPFDMFQLHARITHHLAEGRQ
jgi:hypothetical protein